MDGIEFEHSGLGTERHQCCSCHSICVQGSELAQVGRPGEHSGDTDVEFERRLTPGARSRGLAEGREC